MWLKASYTVEGAIIIPMFIILMAVGMKLSIQMHQEIAAEQEEEKLVDMWLVDDYYRFQIVDEIKDKYMEKSDEKENKDKKKEEK